MTIDIIEMAKAEVNAKVIADMDKAQASFMEARAEKSKAEEMKGRTNQVFHKALMRSWNGQ